MVFVSLNISTQIINSVLFFSRSSPALLSVRAALVYVSITCRLRLVYVFDSGLTAYLLLSVRILSAVNPLLSTIDIRYIYDRYTLDKRYIRLTSPYSHYTFVAPSAMRLRITASIASMPLFNDAFICSACSAIRTNSNCFSSEGIGISTS